MARVHSFLAVVAISVLSPRTAFPDEPGLAGRWSGSLAVGGRTESLSIDFVGAGGSTRGYLNVPRERVLGKPLRALHFSETRVTFNVPIAAGQISFELARVRGRLAGSAESPGGRLPLVLERVGSVPVPPYASRELHFANGPVALSGTLLIPAGAGPFPAVVLIHGSSTPSRNDFRFYADAFARRGIAALIYDKRDVGGDLGGASRVDLRDLAGDALAGLHAVQRRREVDPRKVGLWGHSQGGEVAPIAAASSPDVAFVISFSGPGVTYAELNTYDDGPRLRTHGFSERDIRDAAAAQRKVYAFVRAGGDAPALQAFLDGVRQRPWARYTTLPRSVPTAAERATWLAWRDLDLDPARYWERVRVPSLVAFGADDDVVPAERSARRIRRALQRAGNADYEIHVFPHAGHAIELPAFPQLMVEWVRRRFGAGMTT